MKDSEKNIFSNMKSRLSKMKAGFFYKKKDSGKDLAMAQVLKAKKAGKWPKLEQIKQFPKLISEKERQFFSLSILILIISVIGLSYSIFNLNRITVPAEGGEYTEGLIGIPQLINPLYSIASDVDSDLVNLIFSGLMKYDSVAGLRKDLAESYEISEDGKEYTFTIREDARWHDGAHVRAEDVVFTFNAIQNPEYRSPLDAIFGGIRVERVDERTIKFVLDEPFAPFLSMLTNGILPSHIWQDILPANATVAELNRRPMGSGPYQVEKIVRDNRGNIRSYTLKRHDDYHGQRPYINRLNFRFYPELISAIEALRNRNVQGLSYLPADYVSEFRNMNGIRVLRPALQQYSALFFNQSKNPLLANADMRRAINEAISRDRLVKEALNDFARPADSFLLPKMPGFDEERNPASYDIEKANEILDELEWLMDEESGYRKKGDDILSFTITLVDSSELVNVAENIQEQLAEIGLKINIRKVGTAVFQNEIIRDKDYEILLAGQLYSIEPDPYPFWHSSQTRDSGLNLALFSNRRADERIERARSSSDEADRAEAYSELEEIIRNELPAIFLYQPYYPYVTLSRINGQNLERIVNPYHRFSTINEWYIRTRRVSSGEN